MSSQVKFPISILSVTFDLDGTLLDTVPDLAAAANAMLAELDEPARTHDEVRDFVGKGIPTLVRRCLTRDGVTPEAERLEHATEIFKRHYAYHNGRQSLIYPGVLECLEKMKAAGFSMGIITNKAAAFTEPLVEMKGLKAYMDVVVSGDTVAEKKPHPMPMLYACEKMGVEPKYNLHIGDSHNDINSARGAGCAVFCVPYGYNEGQPVYSTDCDALISSLVEACDLVVKR